MTVYPGHSWKTIIEKADWLAALQCPAMAWYNLRTDAEPPTDAELFRMEQGREVDEIARRLYPDGILVSNRGEKPSDEITEELLGNSSVSTIFNAKISAAPFVAKADVLHRLEKGWHVLEVKSNFSNTSGIDELIDDLSYTVMVFRRAGIRVVKASLVFLSRSYLFGEGPDRLFEIVDHTDKVLERVSQFEVVADSTATLLCGETPPRRQLRDACKKCRFFKTTCLGAGIPHTVLEIPNLHASKLSRLSEEGITDLSRLPEDLKLTERQARARDCTLSGSVFVDPDLRSALEKITWPCHYLDFETVATMLPLYEGHGCHRQVLTQFSIHHRVSVDADPHHSEYLAQPTKNCERQLAEALITALGQQGSILVYSNFEVDRIKELKRSFPDLAVPLQAIMGRIVDLLPIIKQNVYHPKFKGSYSIKKVLPALIADLSYSDLAIQDGDTAITRFAKMARKQIAASEIERTRQELLEYCERDTFAMVRLHETLLRMAQAKGGPVQAQRRLA